MVIVSYKMKSFTLLLLVFSVYILVDGQPTNDSTASRSRNDESVVKSEFSSGKHANGSSKDDAIPKAGIVNEGATIAGPRLALRFTKCETGYRIDRKGKCRKVN